MNRSPPRLLSTKLSFVGNSRPSPSRGGRPGLDELVPSRYALRVGEIDVLVVRDGVLSLPAAMLAFRFADYVGGESR
jgi:hypothetical protein